MIFNFFAYIRIYILIIILFSTKSYIVIPLKSTDDLYLSKISKKEISIKDTNIINQIMSKYINNVLYTDLIIGDPNQISTAFISTDNFGFSYYEEFETKELKELGNNNYNEYSKSISKSIKPTDELNYDFNFWTYLSYEEPLYIYKYKDEDIFSIDNFKYKQMSKTGKEIHFLYGIRNSSRIPNTTDFINMEKKHRKEIEELKKLNFSSFSYFSIGLQLGNRKDSYEIKSFIGEFYSKKEITNQDWSIYYIPKNKYDIKYDNNYIAYLIIGSSPHLYLSNIFNEKEQFCTNSEKYGWSNTATLTFYEIYIKQNNTTISLNKGSKLAELNYNIGLIKGTWYTKTTLDEKFFTPLIQEKKCFQERLNKSEYSYYIYYYCDKNKINENEIKKFPNIYFHHNELSNIFELNSDDLFETFGDILIFKMFFDTSNNWIFGKIFLTKYMFSFNDDNKKIYFYNKLYSDDEDNYNDEENKYLILQIIIIIIAVIVFGVLGFFLGKYIYNKKIIAHELDDIDEDNFLNSENNGIDNNNNQEQNKILP